MKRAALWAVLVGVAVGVLVFLVAGTTTRYTSHARVSFPAPSGRTAISFGNVRLARLAADTASSGSADTVRSALHLEDSAQSLLDGLDVRLAPEEHGLEITYSDRDPEQARRMAQAFAEAAIARRKQIVTDQVTPMLAGMRTQISHYQEDLASVQEKLRSAGSKSAALKNQEAFDQVGIKSLSLQVEQLSALPGQSGGRLTQPAGLAVVPATQSRRQILLAITAGLLAGLIFIAVVTIRRRRKLSGEGEGRSEA